MYLAVYADADFSGCADSLRSTSGGRMNLQGPNTRFPLSGSSKRQGCVSHSTPEAEIVAADVAMRAMGMPALRLMERILGKEPKFVFFDDNKAMISVVRSGKKPTMRHLERSHGVGCMICSRGTTCTWHTRSRTVWLLTSLPKLLVIPESGKCVYADWIARAGNVDRPGNPQDGHIFF